MYSPVKDGIDKTVNSVSYIKESPNVNLSKYIDCFWELKTKKVLEEDFILRALPDACVNIMFNQLDTNIAGVTALHTKYTELNLGKIFHYIGVQLLPGVWNGNKKEVKNSFVGTSYFGELELVKINKEIYGLDFSDQREIMSNFVEKLVKDKTIAINMVIEKILSEIENINTVKQMSKVANLSERQLQRITKEVIGFSPHDFLKVMRLQKSFNENYLKNYSDQAHFIHSFKSATGTTPAKYFKKFNV